MVGKQDRLIKTGQQEQDREDRIAGTGQPKQFNWNRTTRRG
jgi:hypothetical protein